MLRKEKNERCESELVSFGRKVRQLRKIAGLSQAELAELMDFSGSGTISQLETGKVGLGLKNIFRLADILEVNIATLFSRSDYTDKQSRMHLAFYEIMQTPNHPMLSALEAILLYKQTLV